MMKKTHMAIAIATAVPIINYLNIPLINLVGVIGAAAPDWDLIIGLKHRTITHSLLLLFVSTFAISFFSINISIIWFISYSTHLIADSFTKMGVPFLYPLIKTNYGPKLIKTGGAEDMFIFILTVFLISQILKKYI